MVKTKEVAAPSSVQEKLENMRKEIKESRKDKTEWKKEKKDFVKKITYLEKKVEKLENQKTSDINNILSENARIAIKSSKGPLTPDELQNFLKNDLLGKRNIDLATIFGKYSEYDVYEVKHQLLCVHDIVKAHMMHREEQMKVDDKLIKTIENLKIVQQNNPKSNGKRPLNQNSDDNNKENCDGKRSRPCYDSSQDGSQESSQEIHNSQDKDVRKYHSRDIIQMITRSTTGSSKDVTESNDETELEK